MFSIITCSHLFLPLLVACNLQELATKLMDVVSAAPVEIQRDIITSLPEILEDSQHDDIARQLKCVQSGSTEELWFLHWMNCFEVAHYSSPFLISL